MPVCGGDGGGGRYNVKRKRAEKQQTVTSKQ